MIAIRTLGPIAVTVDGGAAPAELLWRKHLGLLIYLARSPRQTRTREHLLGLLWSDRPEPAARHSLNEALRIIRRTAGSDAVTTEVDQVSLAAGVVSLDVDQLETPGCDLTVAGEFLEGFAIPDATGFEEWLAAERRSWRGRVVTALATEARTASGAGRAESAIATAERAARLDPESELAARTLIECLARAGDRAAALGCFQRFVAILADRFGSRPSDDLVALADRLRRSGGRGSRRDPVAGSGDSRRRAPLIGREDTMAALGRAWEIVRAGEVTAIVLHGDDGLGKSRSIADFASQVGVDGGTVAVVRMVETDRDRPHAALFGWLRDGLAEAPGVGGAGPRSLAAAAQVDSRWADRFPATRADAAAPLPEAMLDILEATSREAPVLIVIDDAQWSDPASFAVVERILRDLRRLPILVLLAAAPVPARPELDGIRRRLGHDVPGQAILLEPLGPGALMSLVGWRLPSYDPAATERVARRLAADTAGYPLFAIDLLDAIAAGLEIGGATTPWPNPAATMSQTRPGDLPDTVVAAIRVGFRRLSAEGQAILAAASLGPERLDPARLAKIVELPAARVDEGLDELEWTRWLSADAQGYTFVARISREVVARDFVTGSQRRRCSARWEAVGA